MTRLMNDARRDIDMVTKMMDIPVSGNISADDSDDSEETVDPIEKIRKFNLKLSNFGITFLM